MHVESYPECVNPVLLLNMKFKAILVAHQHVLISRDQRDPVFLLESHYHKDKQASFKIRFPVGWFQFSDKAGNANYSFLFFIEQEKRFLKCQTVWWHLDSGCKCSKCSPTWQCLYVTPRKQNPPTAWLFIQREMSTHLGEGICCTPLIFNSSRNEWDQPSMKSRQVVYHEASPQSLHRVSLFTLMAKDWCEDNFILHSVWLSGGREWIGQTDILWKAHPLFLYPGDWRTTNASGQRTDMKGFLPPIQNLGKDNTNTFFHLVSKAGRTRGGCS